MSRPSDEILAELRALLAELEATGDAAAVDALAADLQRARAAMSTDAPTMDGDADSSWHGMIGISPRMLAVRASIEKFAPVSSPILIRGESGTGKDLVAGIIHELSPRADRVMVSENCAAIPETLLESTLFGHVRGAFTGAVRDHPGHFVSAHKGTLFLDEIGDMPLPMQAKLLRVLQEGELRPVGGEKTRKVDVRVIAATHRDIEQMVRDKTFREDLFYRLNVLQLRLPALRERGDDVVLLARHLLRECATRAGRELRLAPDAERAIAGFAWPGNVRQLQNEIQRITALADGPEVGAAQFSAAIAAVLD